MKIALLCSGLGHIVRGHEVFARDLFNLLVDTVDITLFKGGGRDAYRERVIANVPRYSASLDHIHVPVAPKWVAAAQDEERLRIETETFAYGAFQSLLEGEFDVIHCLEKDVCNILYERRHLFRHTPKLLFSNGGAIPKGELPCCDFVQEYTERNLAYSDRNKAFWIPHGVDLQKFNPSICSSFRTEHGIPEDAFVVLSVGAIAYTHKRMNYVIEEIAKLENAYLVIVGQETGETPAIKALGQQLLRERIVFTVMSHDQLPQAYAAADVFVLGSLFETFGIVYIEAMAMGLPVICTNHLNQRSILKQGIFIDMGRQGALTSALRQTEHATLAELGCRARAIAEKYYDLQILRRLYIERYKVIAASPTCLPRYSIRSKLAANLKGLIRRSTHFIHGRAE